MEDKAAAQLTDRVTERLERIVKRNYSKREQFVILQVIATMEGDILGDLVALLMDDKHEDLIEIFDYWLVYLSEQEVELNDKKI